MRVRVTLLLSILLSLTLAAACSQSPTTSPGEGSTSRDGGTSERPEDYERSQSYETTFDAGTPEWRLPEVFDPAPPEFYPDGPLWRGVPGKRGRGFIQRVAYFKPAEPASFGRDKFPQVILGPPKGGGKYKGSLDVLSLGCGGVIILEFSDPMIADGPGPDFIVFENPFVTGNQTFSEPARISVSYDGKKWYSYKCDPENSDWPYPNCAGVNPVFSNPKNKISPYDPKKAGGEAYDIGQFGLKLVRYVKIEDRSAALPDAKMWCSGEAAGFDLDAISVIWGWK